MGRKNLGFGFMRLPLKGGQIDFEETCRLVDAFIAAGFQWFDTAAPYHSGESETMLRRALVERHDRETFRVTDKLTQGMLAPGEKLFDFLRRQLAKTGLSGFDRYLLHAIDKNKFPETEERGLWRDLAAAREQGLVRETGFSFHDTPEVLETILAAHPEIDLVQLQINYADWETPGIQSRACWECARRFGKRVIVMEPVKGGMLTGLPEPAVRLLKSLHPDWSLASWAIRFAASLDGVDTVLSGMSAMEQLHDNTAIMRDFRPLEAPELDALGQVRAILAETPVIPCTRCGYCLEHCPAQLPIPNLIGVLNNARLFGTSAGVLSSFRWYSRRHRPSECLRCHACEKNCPQHLKISELMAEEVRLFE